MSSALVIIAAVTVFALYLGLRAKRGHDMSLEQWTVGGRSFGTAFVFLLMAGEIYTTFTSSRANTIARRSACWLRWSAWPR
jgi:SSS family solute:Na+ symporter